MAVYILLPRIAAKVMETDCIVLSKHSSSEVDHFRVPKARMNCKKTPDKDMNAIDLTWSQTTELTED